METSCYWRLRTAESSCFNELSTHKYTSRRVAYPCIGLTRTRATRGISPTPLRRRGLSSTERGDDIGEFVDGNVTTEELRKRVSRLLLRSRRLTLGLLADDRKEIKGTLHRSEVLLHQLSTDELLLFENDRSVDQICLFINRGDEL